VRKRGSFDRRNGGMREEKKGGSCLRGSQLEGKVKWPRKGGEAKKG